MSLVVGQIFATGNTADKLFLSNYVQRVYTSHSSIPVIGVNSILQASDGYLWIAGRHGLFRYDGIQPKQIFPVEYFPPDSAASSSVNILHESKLGGLWIGTDDSGIVNYQNGNFVVYDRESGLPSSSVRDIAEDDNGNIYLATAKGIATVLTNKTVRIHPKLDNILAFSIEYIGNGLFVCLLNDGRIILFDRDQVIREFPANHFGPEIPHSLFLSDDNSLYVGTSGNLVYVVGMDMLSQRTLIADGLNTLNGFFKDNSGRLWVVAYNGIGFFMEGTFYHIGGLALGDDIECMIQDHEGNFWIGSSSLGLLQLTRGSFRNVSFIGGFKDDVVNATAIWQGDLYIGSNSGLYILRDNSQIENNLTMILSGSRVMGLLVDSKNQLWISTHDSYGVILANTDGSIDIIDENSGLEDRRGGLIVEGTGGNVYVGMNGGVHVFNDNKIINTFSGENGLVNDFILSIVEDADGLTYFGSDGGGIYVSDGKEIIANYTEKDGLASGIIRQMAFDGNGIWISTGNSVCYLDKSGFRTIERLPFEGRNVCDIRISGDEIWFLHLTGVSVGSISSILSGKEQTAMELGYCNGLTSAVTAYSRSTLSVEGILYIPTVTGVFTVDVFNLFDDNAKPAVGLSGIYADGKHIFAKNDVYTIERTARSIDISMSLISFASKKGEISYMLKGFDDKPITVTRTDATNVSYGNLKGGRYTLKLYGTNSGGIQSDPMTIILVKKHNLFELPLVQVLLLFLLIGMIAFFTKSSMSRVAKALAAKKLEQKKRAKRVMFMATAMADLRHDKGHSRRVAMYSKLLGIRFGMQEGEVETLYCSALLHDIGKIAISDTILNKKGGLSESEKSILKKHTRTGAKMLKDISIMGDISLGARYHHERIDGQGYEGLEGDKIPFMVKIICVCNAFDNIMMNGKYGMSLKTAQSELLLGAGTKYDEVVTATLISLIDEGEFPYEYKKNS